MVFVQLDYSLFNGQFDIWQGQKLERRKANRKKEATFVLSRYKSVDSKNYSGHSLRSGFATVSAESGADERSIMAMTGHKTTQMVRRYIREANLFKNNALNKIKL